MSDFDASQFLDTVFTNPSETEIYPCPIGEYPAEISKLEPRAWKGKDDPSKAGVTLDIFWDIQDDEARKACKKDKVLVKQSVMFTFLPGTTMIDMEKAEADVNFGRLRAAIGLNDGQFSPSMLPGKMARVTVKHRSVDDKIYAEVKSVTRY